MRIAFIATRHLDPKRLSSWAGLPHFMLRSLEAAGAEVSVCRLSEPNRPASLIRAACRRMAGGDGSLPSCEAPVLRHYARQLADKLPALRPDVIFSPSSWPVSQLVGPVPSVFWTDACFAAIAAQGGAFSGLPGCGISGGQAAEFDALRNVSRAIFSSRWAAEGARSSYGVDPAKIRVVPFGANLEERPLAAEVWAAIAARRGGPCRLLLIGGDWVRKGADIAVDAAAHLIERGIAADLTVVGCAPPAGTRLPPFVDVIRFIDKSCPEGRRRFAAVCSRSSFLLLPTRADCTPAAVAEASTFGVPCLAADVGGISSLVAEGVNGRLLDPRAQGIAYADHILGLLREPESYRALAVAAARHAGEHFTWEAAGERVMGILRELLGVASAGAATVDRAV
jgi:glycosyltransferase involved in cell wall biosynthesis